jgi:hypothetical protein
MATILEFRQGERRSASRRSGSDTNRSDRLAEIVFFPGVRYERWADEPAPKQRKRARRRDRIELND